MNGVGEGRFAPGTAAGRAMLVMVLWRMEGAPAAEAAASFSDVEAGAWYAEAVAWAAANGIVTGDGDGRFRPNAPISRQELATLLFRYAARKGAEAPEQTVLEAFPDGGDAASYAAEPLSWAVSAGILRGVETQGEVLLAPKAFATRAQMAAMLARLNEWFSIINKDIYIKTERRTNHEE